MDLISKEIDPMTGQLEEHFFDVNTGKYACRKSWSMDEAVIERNKRLQNDTLDSTYINNNQTFHPAATLDLLTVERLLKEENIDVFNLSDPTNKRRFFRWLEDPENRYLKTTTKKLWRPVSKRKAK